MLWCSFCFRFLRDREETRVTRRYQPAQLKMDVRLFVAVVRVGPAVRSAPWLRLLWAMAGWIEHIFCASAKLSSLLPELVNEFKGASAIRCHGMCKNVSHQSHRTSVLFQRWAEPQTIKRWWAGQLRPLSSHKRTFGEIYTMKRDW